MHGVDTFLAARDEIFRYLVEHAGFRTIALESSWLRGRAVQRYVHDGIGALDDVLANGFSHGFGAMAGNRELVEWMADYNAGRPAAERLCFLGFDGPMEMMYAESPREALALAHALLAAHAEDVPCTWAEIDTLIGADERWSDAAATVDPSRAAPVPARLRVLAHELQLALAAQAPALVAATSRDTVWEAETAARTAVSLLAYHQELGGSSPRRVDRMCGMRDMMMADVLEAAATCGPVLAFAHNQHLKYGPSHMRLGELRVRWHGAGALLRHRLQEGYAVLGAAVGAAPAHGVGVPEPGTVEEWLYAEGTACRLLSAAALPAEGFTARATGNPGYFTLDPALDEFDGILFLRDVREGADCRV